MNEKLQCQTLLKYRQNGLNLKYLISRRKKLFAFRAAAVLICIAFIFLGSPANWLLTLALGLFLGVSIQDLGWMSKLVSSWPLTEKITDWDKVEVLANNQC